jgi:hypothetical protein
LWWTKWHWGRFSPCTSIFSATSNSTNCTTFINHQQLRIASILTVSLKVMPQLRSLVADFPPRQPRFEPRSGGICVGQVALGQVFSEYFSFPCQFSSHQLLHTHHHLSSGTGTIGQIVASLSSGLTPPQEENVIK